MQVTREDLNPCTIKLSVVCEPDEVRNGFDSAFRQLSKKVRLPGFRPGKAPKAMLEQFVTEDELRETAAEEMIRKTYAKAVEGEHLDVDGTTSPQVVLDELDKEEGKFAYTAKVPLQPKVELGDTMNLPAQQPSTEVSEEELDFQLSEMQKRRGTRIAVMDRGVQEGDVAVLNIKPEGVEGDGRNFMTIAGQTFAQLDAAIAGMRVEEIKNLELNFPDTFQEKDWAGQTIQAQVTLNSLSAVNIPELDDSFAQSYQTESVDALRARLREAIGRAKQQTARHLVHEQLVDALMARSQVSVSDNMWENLANRRLQELRASEAKNERTLEQYAEENGMTVEQLAQAWREKAKLEIERALVIQAVFRKEEMKVEEMDLRMELLLMAEEAEVTPTELWENMTKNDSLDELHFRALSRKVGDYLLQHAELAVAVATS